MAETLSEVSGLSHLLKTHIFCYIYFILLLPQFALDGVLCNMWYIHFTNNFQSISGLKCFGREIWTSAENYTT